MATISWRGDAPAVAQVDTLTPGGTIEVGDKFIVTINGKSVSYSATGTTVASVCTGLAAALEASTIPEFEEIDWTDNTTNVLATAATPGKPFTLSVSTTESNGGAADAQTFGKSTTTASSGPNDVSIAANYSGNALPSNGDTLILEAGGSLLYGLDALAAVTLAELRISDSFINPVGLPDINEDAGSDNSYAEYRPQYLQVGATLQNIGQVDRGGGSGRVKIDNGSVATTLNIFSTGASLDQNRGAVIWKGTDSTNVLNVMRGTVDVAPFPGEVATIATVRIGYRNNQASDSIVVLGTGVTLTTINISGGVLTTQSNVTTVNQTGGELIHAAGTLGTLNLDGGAVRYRSAGTLTTANIGSDGNLDFRQDMRTRTVTNCDLFERAELHDPFGTVTFTNGVDLNRCAPQDVTLDTPPHKRITFGSVA